MDDSSNGRAVALYPADPGSNPRSGSIWDHFVTATRIDGCIMSDKFIHDIVVFMTYVYPVVKGVTRLGYNYNL